ncbi:MAG TPA: polysaccharide biosynthesis tyrosine autokinase [Pyrinomonadaceae bacterium]|nr:polysaccharide biosynthesis tyrosine autokinase [Pyrinomonadaceae bacterium]
MSEPSELIKKRDAATDGGPLDRQLQYYPNSRYDSYPGATSGYNRLYEYWRSVRKHIWLILGIVVLVTALTTVYMSRQPDVFESFSRVQVDLETANNPALGALKGNSIYLNTPLQDPTYFNTQITILTSAGLLTRVARTLDLEHNESFLHPQSARSRSLWASLKGFAGGAKEKPAPTPSENTLKPTSAMPQNDVAEANQYEPYVEMLQSQLSVKQLNDTRIIEIRFKHQDPEVAEKVNNMVADTFVQSNLERKTETSNASGDFMQKRIAQLQAEIRHGEEQLLNYAKSHQILSLDASQNTVVDRLAGLNKQLLEAENERKTAEANFKASLAPGALEAQAETTNNSQNSASATTDAKISELKQHRAQLLLEYTEKYPEVKDLDQQIAMLEKQSEQLKTHTQSVVRTNLETRYHQALQKEQALSAAFEKQRAETLTQNEAAVNYRIVQQGIATNKDLLDGLLQRAKENEVILAGTPNNIRVLDRAVRPKAPVSPKRPQAIALAALFSLILGIALARYLDYLDDSVRTSDDVENFLRLPALAVIPALGSFTRRRLLSVMPGGNKKNGNHLGEELLLNASHRSPLAEAYRQLRTSVLLSSAGGAPKTLLVTSSQPGEGKTTTVVNTAMILAQTGAKVVVIDADMRRPRLHSIFGLDNTTGLSGLLASKMSDEEMLATVKFHEQSGLYVLTSGRIPPNPAELLGSDQIRSLMRALQREFTHIVIDSPPVASFTDGVLLSSVADGVLLVVHGGSASRHIVRRSKQLLSDVGAKIFGVVLNNVAVSRQDYYYNRTYERYYYAAETEEEEAPPKSIAS